MLSIDEAAYTCKVVLPEKSYPLLAKELLEIHQTLNENFIDGEDYSYISLNLLGKAFVGYLRETRKDIKDIHSMSRYDLVKDIIKLFDDE